MVASGAVSVRQKYRLRSPATGREILLEAEPGETYVDHESGQPYEVVGKVPGVTRTKTAMVPWKLKDVYQWHVPVGAAEEGRLTG